MFFEVQYFTPKTVFFWGTTTFGVQHPKKTLPFTPRLFSYLLSRKDLYGEKKGFRETLFGVVSKDFSPGGLSVVFLGK